MHIHEQAWSEENSSQNWGQGQQSPSFSWLKSLRVNIIIPSSTWLGAFVPAELKDCIRLLCLSQEEELFCAELLIHDSFPLLPLRSVITETCSRASVVARLRLQNGLNGQKKVGGAFCYAKKATPGISLVVQWLRIHLLMQEVRVRSLVRELILQAKEQLNLCNTTREAPVCHKEDPAEPK